jgi:hypothetical protein
MCNSILRCTVIAFVLSAFGCAQQVDTSTSDASDEVSAPATCEDAGGKPGANCPCDPLKWVPQDCYSGPLGTSGNGLCKAGKRTCSPGTRLTSACVGEVTPQPEVCDLQDNDCDGIVDDVPQIAEAGTIATCNSPACDPGYTDAGIQCFSADLGICGAGRLACGAGGKVTCNSFIHIGAPEVCNGIDDDCNGIIDDGLDQLGACDADAAGACASGQLACIDGGNVCAPSAPSTETCDGVDNDCNGIVDDHACAGQKTAVYCCKSSTSTTYGCTATPNDGLHTNCHAAL